MKKFQVRLGGRGSCRAVVADIPPDAASGLLIESAKYAVLFNPEPQATVSAHAVACGF